MHPTAIMNCIVTNVKAKRDALQHVSFSFMSKNQTFIKIILPLAKSVVN